MAKATMIKILRKKSYEISLNGGLNSLNIEVTKEKMNKWFELKNLIGCVSYLQKMKKDELEKKYDEFMALTTV